MATPRSLLPPATAERLKDLARRGFATALAVADPARVDLRIWRYEPAAGTHAVQIVDTFHVRTAGWQPGHGGDEGIQATSVSGRIRRFLPPLGEPRLKPGDRFELPEIGTAVIQTIQPDRYGIEEATWTLEQGAA